MTAPTIPAQGDTSTSVIRTSAAQFKNQTEFISHVQNTIAKTTSFRELFYTQVPLAWGKAIVDYLNKNREGCGRKHYNSQNELFWIRLMPLIIHDCVQFWCIVQTRKWERARLLTSNENDILSIGVGTTFEFVSGPYSGSRKEPDCYILAKNLPLPRLVIETGWSESHNRLLDDMNTWLVGGNGVTGIAEIYELDSNGMPVMRQSETIFPAPAQAPPVPPQFQVTRGTLFGPSIVDGADPNTLFPFSIDDLRNQATGSLARMNLLPA